MTPDLTSIEHLRSLRKQAAQAKQECPKASKWFYAYANLEAALKTIDDLWKPVERQTEAILTEK